MRYMYARFKGYIGFYNGMGLEEVAIDFSKCVHKICIISGRNGCGKSTLLNHLHPLPDESSDYITNHTAEKELHLLDGDTLYQILIVSAVKSPGNRATTKAYIRKNGLELNPNGNISSYRDIIFSEFELDPNYIALSKLSMEDKGLVSKKPAERKRFLASILNSLEYYNSINKVLVKKSNIFKSYINNISNKIRSIGDEEQLHSSLFNIENRYHTLIDRKSEIEKYRTEAETFIKLADPDGAIQEKYNQLYELITKCNDTLKNLDPAIESYQTRYGTIDIDREVDNINSIIIKLSTENNTKQSKIHDILDTKEEELHILDIKRQKLTNIKSDFEINNLRSAVQMLRNNIKSQERIFKDSKITNFDISRDEYINIFSTMKRIKSMIIQFKDNRIDIIQEAVSIVRAGTREKIYRESQSLQTKISQIESDLVEIDQNILVHKNSLSIMEVLSKRPKECTIDTCPLIENAINVQKTNPKESIIFLEQTKEELLDEKKTIEVQINHLSEVIKAVNDLLTIMEIIHFSPYISKVEMSYILLDQEEFLRRIETGNTFNEIEDSDLYIQRAQDIESYRTDKETLIQLEADLKIAEDKQFLIEEMTQEILSIEEKLSKAQEETELLTKQIAFNNGIISDNQKKINDFMNWKGILDSKKTTEDEKEKYLSQYREIKSNLEQIKTYLDNINYSNGELIAIENELKPLEEKKKIIEHSLITLQECKNEFEMYNEKSVIVEKLKKYSTPSSDSIQTKFINIYMADTLKLANQLLSMLFLGEYKLLPYIINGNEFRLPFVGESGMEVDDISSGSGSQVAMMGMIINFVLLFQGSTKYNIAGSDELDETLDTYNRLQYAQLIYKVVDILNIDQCLLISHSPEIDRSNMDVIQFKENNQTDCYGEGNIIFNYYQL